MTTHEVALQRTYDPSGSYLCRRERSGLVALRLLSRIVGTALGVAMAAATAVALLASF